MTRPITCRPHPTPLCGKCACIRCGLRERDTHSENGYCSACLSQYRDCAGFTETATDRYLGNTRSVPR